MKTFGATEIKNRKAMYRIEVHNRREDTHIENIDFDSDNDEEAIDELEELSTLPSVDSLDPRGYKYELQLWRISDSREAPDELIETGYTNEYTDHREFYCIWTKPEYEEQKTEINFIDFFLEDNGYLHKEYDAINSLEVMGHIKLSDCHAVMRIS